MKQIQKFTDFQIGEFAFFKRRFSQAEFAAFSDLSGDRNPLHHDVAYAELSEFKKPVVPMHMTIAPFSRIAGMIFPGQSSLYLSHEIRSSLPVFYDEELTYSAKIISINDSLRTLRLRVLVFRGSDVVLDAELHVMSRVEEWEVNMDDKGTSVGLVDGCILITGATGEIGSALAKKFATLGWNLLLVDRGPGEKRTELCEKLKMAILEGKTVEFLTTDLSSSDAVSSLCDALAERNDIAHVIHTASPPIHAALQDLVQVNYTALKEISTAVLPGLLARQSGHVVFIGSVVTERAIPTWENYSAVKAMVAQYVAQLDKANAIFGIRGLNILSGLVDTEYSAEVQNGASAMLPEELAEKISTLIFDEGVGESVIIEWNRTSKGKFGFTQYNEAQASIQLQSQNTSIEVSSNSGGDVEFQIEQLLKNQLKLPQEVPLKGGGVSITQGWDSLRHIELILELEKHFSIRYDAQKIEKCMMFDTLVEVTEGLIGSN